MTLLRSFMAILLSRFFLNLRHAYLTQDGTTDDGSSMSEPNFAFASRAIGDMGALEYSLGTDAADTVVELVHVGTSGSSADDSYSSTQIEAHFDS